MKSPVFYSIFIAGFIIAGFVRAGVPSEAGGPCAMRLVVLGDRVGNHIPGVYEEVLDEVNLLRPDIIVTVGDHIEGYLEDTVQIRQQWHEYDSLVARLTAPLYLTPGNHDITTDIMEPLFKGDRPHPYYSFDFKTVHFVILDNSRFDSPDAWPKEQLAWLEKDLQEHAAALFTLVFFHKPFWFETLAVGKSDPLHDVFVRYSVDAVFTGHYHEYFSGVYDGIKYVGVGSSGAETEIGPTGIEYHFMWVTFDDQGINIALVEKGALRPWDDLTAADRRTARNVEYNGLALSRPFVIGSTSNPPDSTFAIVVNNLSSDAIDDTLVWKVPETWSIQPEKLAMQVAAGQTQSYNFKATRMGPIYPLPEMSMSMPFTAGREIPVKKPLRIARIAEASAAGKVKIDGLLDESCWTNFEDEYYDWDGGPARTDRTRFVFTYDEHNLYLGAVCYESRMDSIMANVTEHDGPIFGEDCVGYFLQPDPDTALAYQIYFNPRGTCYDAKINVEPGGYTTAAKEWNGKYRVKTTRGQDFWSVEACLPLEQFGVIARKGSTMNLNFRRKQKHLGTAADWMEIDHHPDTYGILLLK